MYLPTFESAPGVAEALGIGHGCRADIPRYTFPIETQVPLSDYAGRVARPFEDFRYCRFFGMRHGMQTLDVTRFSDANRIRSRHQRRPRNAANGLRVETG